MISMCCLLFVRSKCYLSQLIGSLQFFVLYLHSFRVLYLFGRIIVFYYGPCGVKVIVAMNRLWSETSLCQIWWQVVFVWFENIQSSLDWMSLPSLVLSKEWKLFDMFIKWGNGWVFWLKSPAIIHIVDGLHAIACIIFPSMPCRNFFWVLGLGKYMLRTIASKRGLIILIQRSSISPVSPSNKNVLSVKVMSDLIPIAMPPPTLSKPPYLFSYRILFK